MYNFLVIFFLLIDDDDDDDEVDDDDIVLLWYGYQRKSLSLIYSRDHCHRPSSPRSSNKPGARFQLARSLSSGLVE